MEKSNLEMVCSGFRIKNCLVCALFVNISLLFQDINRKSTNVVESWGGTKEKQAYTHVIFKNATFTFTWAFQRTNQGQDVSSSLVSLFSPLLSVISIRGISISAGDAKGCKWRHHTFHTWHYKLRKLTCSLHRSV